MSIRNLFWASFLITSVSIASDCAEHSRKIHLRAFFEFEKEDLTRIAKIEKASFESPWSKKELIRLLSPRDRMGIVAVVDGKIQGFVLFEVQNFQFEVLDFAVHPKARRQGIATALFKDFNRPSIHRNSPVIVDIGTKNEVARQFLLRLGYEPIPGTSDPMIARYKYDPARVRESNESLEPLSDREFEGFMNQLLDEE